MKGKPKLQSKQLFGEQEDYEVWGFYERGCAHGGFKTEQEFSYIILDDNFFFHCISQQGFQITDKNTEGYECIRDYTQEDSKLFFRPELKILFKKSLPKELNFPYAYYPRTWLAKLLKERGVKLNEELTNELENENDKLLQISGFIDFANDYINYEQDGDLTYHIYFDKDKIDTSTLASIINGDDKTVEVTLIDPSKIYDEFQKFIHSSLFNGRIINKAHAAETTARKLLLEIDSIFVQGMDKAYFIKGDWEDKFVIVYHDNYYILEHGFSD